VAQVAYAAKAGTPLPAKARFVDEHGRPVELGQYFGRRPLVLVLGYYGCSNLCSYVLRGLASGLDAAGLQAGRDIDVVVISIASLETPAMALHKKHDVLGGAAAAAQGKGWHFLTGQDDAIRAVTAALGFRYTFDASGAQYAHAAGVTVLAPDGRVVRMLPGVTYPRDVLRASLRDAAQQGHLVPASLRAAGRAQGAGTTGGSDALTSTEPPAQRWLLCFHYDPHTGRYSFAAMSAVRAAAIAALLALCGFVAQAWLRERRASQRQGNARP
jgi:protein SCO1/2